MALRLIMNLGRFVEFILQTLLAMPMTLIMRPGLVLRQFERIAWGTVPLIVVGGLSVGLVTWLQTHRLLVRYGVEATMPSVLAAAVLVETGPILTSVLVAARIGAGLAAELSSKVLTEEVEAAEILGAPTIPSYVAPRVLATLVAVPLLTVLLDAAALFGGFSAERIGGSMTSVEYLGRSLDYLRLPDVLFGTLKTGLFGLIIGVTSSWFGLRSPRSTDSIGHAATRGVVASILFIFVANVLLVSGIQWVRSILSGNFLS